METIFLYSLIIAGLILVTFACIKWETARWLTASFVTCLAVFGAVVSAFRINAYYNTKGGIIGYLNGIIHPNQVEITAETLTFDFSNVALLQEDDDTYVAKIEEPLILELEKDEKYGVYVNGSLCDYLVHERNNLSQSTDYVQVVYDHAFYDKDMALLMRDKLKLSFAFYKNSSQIIVETSGGSDAVKLWNAYFTKNNFKVEIKPIEEIYFSSETISMKFYSSQNELYAHYEYVDPVSFAVPEDPEMLGYNFLGWTIDGSTLVDFETFKLTEDTCLFAVYEAKEVNLNLKLMNSSVKINGTTYSEDTSITLKFDEEFSISEAISLSEDREFVHYKFDCGTGYYYFVEEDSTLTCEGLYLNLFDPNSQSFHIKDPNGESPFYFYNNDITLTVCTNVIRTEETAYPYYLTDYTNEIYRLYGISNVIPDGQNANCSCSLDRPSNDESIVEIDLRNFAECLGLEHDNKTFIELKQMLAKDLSEFSDEVVPYEDTREFLIAFVEVLKEKIGE